MPKRTVTVATRRSALALAQSRAWMQTLREASQVETEELHVVTTGDRIQDRPLSEVGGKGLFIKEIEEALLDGRADCAVHSLKDVPGELADGLFLACVPAREPPNDVITTRSGCSFLELPKGATVGTSSLRRMTQLRIARPDLEYVPIRGNVDTRLKKCEDGTVDAVVLACAGMRRLGLGDRYTEELAESLCLPAVGQGALAIEIRSGDRELIELLRPLSHEPTRIAVEAERGVLVSVEGNCQVPVAGFAIRDGEDLWLRGMLAEPDGSRLRRQELRAPWPSAGTESDRIAAAFELGKQLGRRLLAAEPDVP